MLRKIDCSLVLSSVCLLLAPIAFGESALTFDLRKAVCHDFNETNECPTAKFIVRQTSQGYIDRSFAIGHGQPGLVTYFWGCTRELLRDRKRIGFRIVIPAGFDFVDAAFAQRGSVKKTSLADGSLEVRCGLNLEQFHGPAKVGLDNWYRLGLMLRSVGRATDAGELTIAVLYDGESASNVARTRLFTIPPVKVSAPRRYATGMYYGGWYCQFGTEAGNEAFAELMTDAGARWVIPSVRNELAMKSWRKHGITRITPDWYWISDGFRLGNPKGRSAETRLVANKDGPEPYGMEEMTCPMAVYLEDDHFLTNTVPEMTAYLKGCDGMSANWEPERFCGRACACPRCEAEAREAGIPWPQFRARQHARVVKTIDKYVRAATGGEKSLGFLPAVNTELMNDSKYDHKRGFEMWVDEYAGSLRWINPWGPYMYWETRWRYNPKDHDDMMVCQFVMARNTRQRVDKDYPAGGRPKILAFVHASEMGGVMEWLVQPEWLEIAMDSHFFNGWEGTMAYFFPRGYDARYWRAFANATARAAACEDFVLDGRRVDEKVEVVPDEKRTYRKCWFGLQWLTDLPLVQHAAYDLGDKRIVALFNFCGEKSADVTFRTRLASGRYRLTMEGETKPTGDFDEAALAAGIRLKLGNCRCRVLTIERFARCGQ